MNVKGNRSWNLERFVDSFILELDRAQDTLAVKGLNRKLTYTVRDVSLDLQVFPQFDGERVSFTTAGPNQDGSSRLTIQLGSITDRQIVEHADDPVASGEVKIEDLEDLDEDTRHSLQAVGIRSERELNRLAERNVDVGTIVERKTGKRTDYSKLADMIRRSRRATAVPRIQSIDVGQGERGPEIVLTGENLALDGGDAHFPAAVLNDRPAPITRANRTELCVHVQPGHLRPGANQLSIALDSGAIVTLNIET